jgi:membrane protease YdiL (CAAX protease family)
MAAISIATVTAAFLTYHYTTSSVLLRKKFEEKFGEEKAKIGWVHFQRLFAVFCFGVVPLVILASQNIDFQSVGLNFNNFGTSLKWIFGLGAVVVIMNYFAARTDDNLSMYPQIRMPAPWPVSLKIASALTWAAYLLGYEFMFRGFLLFSCFEELDKTLAIVINVALYALVHLPKGWKETIGAIPLGIVLCLLTLQTGNIWIAFLVHVAMALSNEWWSLWWMGKKAV